MNEPREWSFEDSKALSKYAGKLSVAALAQMLDRTIPAIKSRAQKQGLCLVLFGELNPTAKYSDATVERARRLYESGHGPESISRQMQVSIHTVRSWVYFYARRNDQIQPR